MISNYISDHLIYASQEQLGSDDLESTPINIFLEDGSSYLLSFIVHESDDFLNIVYTDKNGYEKIAILNKNFITAIQLCYLDEFSHEEETDDLMCM